jgi:2-polyprenyl-6-methoxyphenol hydroxylase-like FAD-dependent oxidoreductase
MERTPVLVVGAGPVGMVAALECAHHGVRCVLVDSSTETTRHPRLDVVNARSMELLDRLGLADEIRAAGVTEKHGSDVIWSTGLTGEPISVWRLPSVAECWQRIREHNDGTQPAQPWQRLSQILLEPVLARACHRHPLIDTRRGWRFESLTQDEHGVSSKLVSTTTDATTTVRSQYLIGCDGAASQVRRTLGIGLDGFAVPRMPEAFMVHLRSRDLTTLHRHGRFWHYFAFRYVILAQDEIDTWTVHVNGVTPGEFDTPPTDPARFVRDVLGVDLAIDRVELTSRWRPQFLAAERYRAGRVLLAGDSAHQMFPTGGYGMNTGVGDAVDAAWKVAALVNGYGGTALLDSYEFERRPVGLRNLRTSRRHLGVHFAAGDLVRSGVSHSEVAAFLRAERGENEYAGVELGYRYDSPVIWQDEDPEPDWRPDRYTPTTWPGGRPPSVVLHDDSFLFQRFGREFTLVDFAGDGRASPLLDAAAEAGVPITHTVVRDRSARELWARDLVLLRPDQHVAWRGNRPPVDPANVIGRVRGTRSGAHTPH